jgi:hypothetical protein
MHWVFENIFMYEPFWSEQKLTEPMLHNLVTMHWHAILASFMSKDFHLGRGENTNQKWTGFIKTSHHGQCSSVGYIFSVSILPNHALSWCPLAPCNPGEENVLHCKQTYSERDGQHIGHISRRLLSCDAKHFGHCTKAI